MSILDIDFTNYHKVQASRMTLTSRSGLRAKLEQDLQAYLANGGTITTLPSRQQPAATLTGPERNRIARLPK